MFEILKYLHILGDMLMVFSVGLGLLLYDHLSFIYLFKQQALNRYWEPGTTLGIIGKMMLGDCAIFPLPVDAEPSSVLFR